MDHVIVWDGMEIIGTIAFLVIMLVVLIVWFIFDGLDTILFLWDQHKREKNKKEYDKKFEKDNDEIL